MNPTPEKHNGAETDNKSPEQKREENNVISQTKVSLKALKEQFKTALAAKFGNEKDPRYKAVMKKVGKIESPGRSLQLKAVAHGIGSFMNFFGKDKATTSTAQIDQMATNLGGVGNQIDEITGSMDEVKQQFDGAFASMSGDDAVDGISGDPKFDAELNKLENDAKARKKDKAMTMAIYKGKVALWLQALIVSIGWTVAPSSTPDNTPPAETNEWYAEHSHYNDKEKEQINNVIAAAKQYDGVPYHYGGNDKSGIDCSGLWSRAFDKEYKKSGERFDRLTAAIFDSKAPDIARGEIEKGDRMFWDDPQGIKKGGKNAKGETIYHIEMVVGKPFEKDGKRCVKTYGSSSDKNVIDAHGVSTGKNGVGYRIRQMDKGKHHFARPSYYEELVAMNESKHTEDNTA